MKNSLTMTVMGITGIHKSGKHFKRNAIGLLLLSLLIVVALDMSSGKYLSSTISIQYKGIGNGMNPDGTRFDTNELISEGVIKAVFEEAKMPYQPETLVQFEVRPVLPAGIVNTIKTKREKGELYTYFPNEFEIRVHPMLFGEFGYEDAKKLSEAYQKGYEKFFKETYQYPFVNLGNTFGNFDYTKYDYPEVTKVFENEYKLLISYLSVLQEEDPNYKSEKGYSFQDMIATLKSSKNLDLDRISAMVSAFNLTKNKELLILKYDYMIRRYDLEKSKDLGEYSVSAGLLSLLKSKDNGVVLPSLSGTPVTVKSVDPSYDVLAKKSNEALVTAGNKQEDVKFFQKEIVKLQTSLYSPTELVVAEKEATVMIKVLNGKLQDWVTTIKSVANEYFDKKYGSAIKLTGNSHLSGGLSLKKTGLAVVGLWLSLLILATFWKKEKH
jgi:hypothetical protein